MPPSKEPLPLSSDSRFLLSLSFAIAFFAFLLGFWWYSYSVAETFRKIQSQQSNNTIFYDIDRQPFHIIKGIEDRKYTPLKKISRNLQMAVVAIEDTRFFRHLGFDPIRLVGAGLRLFQPNSVMHGASTITQQLVKLSLLSPERTFSRKLKELFYAVSLELQFSKEEILEFYLNKVYLGHRNYGVENAALNYFHKSAQQLTLAESALIAGLIKKPEGYSPFSNLKGARTRQLLVLRRLRQLDWVTQEQYIQAINERILIRKKKQSDLRQAPYYTNHVLSILKSRYSSDQIFGGGLKVYTTLNRNFQQAMEKAIATRLAKPKSFAQIGAVSLDPATGLVYALVGGADFELSEFNRVTQAKRQPGSAIKPILYSAALARGVKITDVFVDEPTQYPLSLTEEHQYYEPQNYNHEFQGPMTVAHALKISNNVVSVKILNRIGVSAFVRTAERFGLRLPQDRGLCLALGCGEVTLLNLVKAYTAFANNGQINEPVFILKVTDSKGRVYEEYQPQKPKTAISAAQAFQMNALLQKVVEEGTGRAAKIGQPMGGKTGTTDEHRDAWFIGFTPDLVTGFWIGNDDNQPMEHEFGGKTPARLWKAYMTSIERNQQKTFPLNTEFQEFQICEASGKLANSWCDESGWFPLRPSSAPQEYCDLHDQSVEEVYICMDSKKLAGDYCPPERIAKQRYYNGTQPVEYCDFHGPDSLEPQAEISEEPSTTNNPDSALVAPGQAPATVENPDLPELVPNFEGERYQP